MTCGTAKESKQLFQITLPSSFVDERRAICKACIHGKNTPDCLIVESRNPGRANIESGIRRASLKCPKDNWYAVKTECPRCRRMEVISESIGACRWCALSVRFKPVANITRPLQPLAFNGSSVRNLHYFLYPRSESSTRYHLDKLRESIDTFNGKRICCVATDAKTIEQAIADDLNRLFTHVYYRPNDPRKREGVGFLPSLELLKTKSSKEVICFAHAKGQQPHTEQSDAIRKWSDAMYETVVNNWPAVKDAMEQGYPIAGSFKSLGAFRSTMHKWHYSGSFWWARSASLFANPHWRNTCSNWWLSESYVGRHWTRDEGYCLFGDNIVNGSLYHASTWADRIDKELEEFRKMQLVAT